MTQDAAAAYATLATGAGLVDLSDRGLLELAGEDRVRFLNGQTTNDVASLQPGRATYSAFVNAKGKMRADGNILCFTDRLWIDTEPGLAASLAADLDKFIIADDVRVENMESRFHRLGVIGPQTPDVLRAVKLELPAEPNRFSEIGGGPFGALVVLRRAFGPDVFCELFCGAGTRELTESLQAGGARPVEPEALDVRRIELGIPRFGVDMDGGTLPPEAGLESTAISYTKGCYIGQEVISRIKSVGHVNRHLTRLKFSGPAAPGSLLLRDGLEAGRVTSIADIPQKGWLGLGYVKRGLNAGEKLKGDGFEAMIL